MVCIKKKMKDPGRLNTREEETLEKIEDWMDDDIKAMISGVCNVYCATLLSIVMDVLGGIAEETLIEEGKEKARPKKGGIYVN